jgi:uncharacterized Zn finger protein (UPF0148 family)
MSPAQQAQENWVKERLAAGQPVLRYSCPRCGEPCFVLPGLTRNMAECPHCCHLHQPAAEELHKAYEKTN